MDLLVSVFREAVVLPTYVAAPPDRYPQFLEHRVYQGSSGRVYPLPVCDRIALEPRPQVWSAVFLENAFLRVMILPQLGGRIHRIVDKATGRDLIYYQPVIKPALVGLAGPWVSGGIEFNWPQHHRPSTTLPTQVAVEEADDGSVTVWLSEHDPMVRMKGMHGVCLHPACARVELRARIYNRTDDVQTFLWWANVGLEAHEQYQSFFPPDVQFVADHAKRAMTEFPLSRGTYYGVDYAARARDGVPASEQPRQYRPPAASGAAGEVTYAPNDLSWYANIPVPTSYMCVGSTGDFCGGYDHRAGLGLVHVADHHIAPGKKQWTWGNHEFGYAWDRNLTDARPDGAHPPYIELMAGAFTDNQPDFSYLQPGETRRWSQFWYPIHGVGVPRHANAEAAVDLRVEGDGRSVNVRVAVTRQLPDASVRIVDVRGRELGRLRVPMLAPAQPCRHAWPLPRHYREDELRMEVCDRNGATVITYGPKAVAAGAARNRPEPAQAPPSPGDVAGTDELYLIGLHLEQYRHATRCPTGYWREALRRDPGDSRCNLALGRWYLRRGEFAAALELLQASVARLTLRNPNPAEGEAYYQMGRCLRQLGRDETAYAALAKGTWNQGWAGACHLALAELDVARGDWAQADDHLTRARGLDVENLRARNLHAVVMRRRGRWEEALELLDGTLAVDPLDAWAGWLRHERMEGDEGIRLDVAHDFARAGLWREALAVLASPARAAGGAAADLCVMTAYTRAWFWDKLGQRRQAAGARKAARQGPPDRSFPARLEDRVVLGAALATDPADARAHALLGHWLYDRRRHAEAMAHWEQAVRCDPANAVAWRCLGMARFNIAGDARGARRAYEQAIKSQPNEPRLRYERDQLWKRCGVSPVRRRRALSARPDLVTQRDDLVVELAGLHNQLGQPERALQLLRGRHFQPWEGGEGEVLRHYTRARLLLGRAALAAGAASEAAAQFAAALEPPPNLGEARHLLVNPSEVQWWWGEACAAGGDRIAAREHWRIAAEFKGDFQGMSTRPYSEMTAYSARALARLGRPAQARRLFEALRKHARELGESPAEIDYFATSLPTMLLFKDDLAARQRSRAHVLEAQALAGLGAIEQARALVAAVLQIDPGHAVAADLAAELT